MERYEIVFNALPGDRYEYFQGRRHIVRNAVIMTAGIREGNKGKILYDEEFLNKRPRLWNYTPIVNFHPPKGTAADIVTLNNRGLGFLFNTRNEGGWQTECWFDDDWTYQIDPDLHAALVKNDKPIETSTGIFLEVAGPGTWNGQPYDKKAIDWEPDHLATLLGSQGACSVKDGCGIGGGVVKNDDGCRCQHPKDDNLWATYNRYYSSKERQSMPESDFGDPSKRAFPVKSQSDIDNASKLIGHAADPAAVKRRLISIAKKKGLAVPAAWKAKTSNESVANQMSFSEISSALYDALCAAHGKVGQSWYGWVQDIYEDHVVFYNDGKYYAQDYTASEAAVELTGDPTEVVRHTEYMAVDGSYVGNAQNGRFNSPAPEVSDMAEKKERVDAIIKNGVYLEADREWLMSLADNRLAPLEKINKPTTNAAAGDATVPVTPPPAAPVVPPVANADKPAMTAEDWWKLAPPEVQRVVNVGIKSFNDEKARLVEAIKKSPVANQFYTDERLARMDDLDELRAIALMASPQQPTNNAFPGFNLNFNNPPPVQNPPNYAGAAAPPGPTTNASGRTLAPLKLPKMPAPEPAKN